MEYPSLNKPPAGSIRFNTDSSKMEIYNGDKWWNIDSTSPEEQTGGTRAIFSGSYSPMNDAQSYINVDSTGNGIDFGDYVGTDRMSSASAASRTRGLVMGGYPGNPSTAGLNDIDCNIFSSTGSAFDFGNLSQRYTNLLDYLQRETDVDFGKFINPGVSSAIVDLGSIAS